MARVLRVLVVVVCLAAAWPAGVAGADVTLFRLYLLDGTVLTSYGEFARVDDSVIFSMPVGGKPEEPRIHVTSVKAALVDWPRTDRYSASARYQRYAETRGEEDFRILSNEVALALNDIALSSNRQQALALAEGVRRTVADWPRTHYGYRQNDVREIVSVLDQAISTLRAARERRPSSCRSWRWPRPRSSNLLRRCRTRASSSTRFFMSRRYQGGGTRRGAPVGAGGDR